MSGPKSARYTLTPEQRRILTEARERERKTRREWDKLQQHKNELATIKGKLDSATKNIDMLVDRIGDGKEEQQKIHKSISQIQSVIEVVTTLSLDDGLEKLQAANIQAKTIENGANGVISQYENQSREISSKLYENIEDSIADGMRIRFDEEIKELQTHLEQQREKIKELISDMQSLNVGIELQEEGIAILEKAQEIVNDGFIDNFYAMTVLPYIKKCKKYNEQFAEYGEEFEELVSKHKYYSEYLGIPDVTYVFSIEILEVLRREVTDLENQYVALEEQRYISESLDQVMRDMGYNVVGSREVTKKSGRKFKNELYHFSEGAVVNVTYAANGQISMELGGVDTCDREPSEEECSALCDEMVEFCDEFPEIEKRLKEKGVILMNRISMLPPAEEYAQIINVSDYEITENIETFEAENRKQNENRKQVLRRE